MVHWLHRPASAPIVPLSPPNFSSAGPPLAPPLAREFHEEDLTCSICRDILSDPIVLTETGRAYDAHCIRLWFLMGGKTCPMTGVRLQSRETARAPEDLVRAAAAAAAAASDGGGEDGDEGEWWTPVIAAMPSNGAGQPSTSYSRGRGGAAAATAAAGAAAGTAAGWNRGGSSSSTSSRGDHFRAVGANLRGILKRKWIAARTRRTAPAAELGVGGSLGATAAAAAATATATAGGLSSHSTRPESAHYWPSAAAIAASAAARPKSAAPASGDAEEKRWWFGGHDQ